MKIIYLYQTSTLYGENDWIYIYSVVCTRNRITTQILKKNKKKPKQIKSKKINKKIKHVLFNQHFIIINSYCFVCFLINSSIKTFQWLGNRGNETILIRTHIIIVAFMKESHLVKITTSLTHNRLLLWCYLVSAARETFKKIFY